MSTNPTALSLIRRAVRAPSSHNTQPWLFRVSESVIELYADRTRALPVNDPDDRELAISCGCALMNLRVAAAAEGLDMRIQVLPVQDEPGFLARALLAGTVEAPAGEGALAGFIEQRHTCRKRFSSRKVEAAVLDALVAAAEREGAWLRPLMTGSVREKVADLVAAGDAKQWANPSWRRELAGWMRPRRRGDGLTVPTLAAPVIRFAVRSFDMGRGVGAKNRKLATASPLLAVLGTNGDRLRDWLGAGQALERFLLVACRHGLQASYLNQPIQVASLRPKLQDLVGAGYPQILLCLGHPVDAVSATPRRDVAAVIDDAANPRQSRDRSE